jgi:hypothetical protein
MSDPAFSSGYSGPERRLRVAYVTRHTEYHTQGGVCVAVRSRVTGQWLLRHSALGRRISAAIRLATIEGPGPGMETPDDAPPSRPRVGDALYFGTDGPDVVTTNLLSIARPERTTVCTYPV